MTMIEVQPAQITPALRALFREDLPAGLRCFAVLAGDNAGRIWTDDLQNPTWGIVQEGAFGTLYLEGTFPHGLLTAFINQRRQYGDVLYGFWDDDDALKSHFPEPGYRGRVFEGIRTELDRGFLDYLNQIPPDCTLRPIDRDLFRRIEDYTFYSEMFGSPERALERSFGYCLMRGDDLLCEAFAGTSFRDVIEIGVNTREAERNKGYAKMTCAAVIQEAEQRGYQAYWNCAAQNIPSFSVASQLGWKPMRKYSLLGWF